MPKLMQLPDFYSFYNSDKVMGLLKKNKIITKKNEDEIEKKLKQMKLDAADYQLYPKLSLYYQLHPEKEDLIIDAINEFFGLQPIDLKKDLHGETFIFIGSVIIQKNSDGYTILTIDPWMSTDSFRGAYKIFVLPVKKFKEIYKKTNSNDKERAAFMKDAEKKRAPLFKHAEESKKYEEKLRKMKVKRPALFTDKLENGTKVEIEKSYTPAEFKKISHGFRPESMDDHWTIFLEDDWLYFHRSWTWICIYKVHFTKKGDKYAISEAYVNSEPVPGYREKTTYEYDKALILWLIDALLLGKKNIPLPK